MGSWEEGLRQLAMSGESLAWISLVALVTSTNGDTRTGLSSHSGGGNSGLGGGAGYGAPSTGYGAPPANYGAPVTSYGAPSGGSSGYGGATGGVSTGYGAPSGGESSGYSAPCDSYGCGGGESAPSYDAPIYVYQQQATTAGGSKHGGLAALLPLGGLALLAPLALFTLLTVFPTTAIVSGRKRREADESLSITNSSMLSIEEERAVLLSGFLQEFGIGAEKKLQQDMVAHYLQCGAGERGDQSFLGCLEQLSCTYHHPKLNIPPAHKRIAAVVLHTLTGNEFVGMEVRQRLKKAAHMGRKAMESCNQYKCNHHLLQQQQDNNQV